jgi:hypothetical protein
VPDELEPPPPESELDEAEAIVSALGAGTTVSPDLPDEGPGVLIKGLAAHRDDIDREPLRDFRLREHIEQGGHVSGFDDLADQFLGLKGQVPKLEGAKNEVDSAITALDQLKQQAQNITGATAGSAFQGDMERVKGQVAAAQAAVAAAQQALSEVDGCVETTAEQIRNRTLG